MTSRPTIPTKNAGLPQLTWFSQLAKPSMVVNRNTEASTGHLLPWGTK
jgi:hypothetical protein